MSSSPKIITFGSVAVVSPDGAVADELWPELAAIVLLEPEPELLQRWISRLERRSGVEDRHRRIIDAGGETELRASIATDHAARGLLIDDFTKAADLPWPGEGPEPSGHALTRLEDEDDADNPRRISGVRRADAGLSWYLLRSATRQERRAEAGLIEAGLAVYVPRLTRWHRIRRDRFRIEQPLFGGYLFVGLGPGQSLYGIEDIDGVHAPVRFARDAAPRALNFAAITGLVDQELTGAFDRTRRDRSKDPAPGTAVRLVGGRFRGFDATFVERRDDERIQLMFHLFGRASPLVVDPEDVELPEPP